MIAKDRTYGAAHFQKALALVAAGRPEEAAPEYSKAEDSGLEPKEIARVLFYQGYASLQAGRTQEAAEAFRRGIDTDPSYTPSWLWAAKVNSDLTNARSAAKGLMAHIKADPLAYLRDRQMDDWWAPVPSAMAVADVFVKALDGEAFAPELHAAAGVALFHSGKTDTADAYLKAAIEQDSSNGAALFYRGLIAHKAGRSAQAAKLFEDVMGVTNNVGVFHIYLADALLAQNKLDASLSSFDRGMAYGGKDAWSLTRQAEALSKAGREDDAREKLEAAVKLDPRSILPRRAIYKIPT